MFTYSLGGHAFGLGYQGMSGDTGFAYINGADAFLVNFVQIGDFASKDEQSWQARYDYNFAAVGVPGLTFMTRYINGSNIDRQQSPRRQGMGARYRHWLRGPEWPVEECRGEMAQRDRALEPLWQRPR
jgi:hypothetical protein